MGHGFEVIRIDAPRDTAEVVKLGIFRYRAYDMFVYDPMSEMLLAVMSHPPVAVLRVTLPQPVALV